MELVPIEKDAYFGPYVQLLLARVHMMVGSKDKAVELLEAAGRGAEQSLEGLAAGGSDVRSAAEPSRFQALVGGTP